MISIIHVSLTISENPGRKGLNGHMFMIPWLLLVDKDKGIGYEELINLFLIILYLLTT